MAAMHPALDAVHLRRLYGDDTYIIQVMMEAFLSSTLPRWDQLGTLLQTGQYERVREVTHELKPSFSMVGLTGLHAKVEGFEQALRNTAESAALRGMYQDIWTELQRMKPVLEEEVIRLGRGL